MRRASVLSPCLLTSRAEFIGGSAIIAVMKCMSRTCEHMIVRTHAFSLFDCVDFLNFVFFLSTGEFAVIALLS